LLSWCGFNFKGVERGLRSVLAVKKQREGGVCRKILNIFNALQRLFCELYKELCLVNVQINALINNKNLKKSRSIFTFKPSDFPQTKI